MLNPWITHPSMRHDVPLGIRPSSLLAPRGTAAVTGARAQPLRGWQQTPQHKAGLNAAACPGTDPSNAQRRMGTCPKQTCHSQEAQPTLVTHPAIPTSTNTERNISQELNPNHSSDDSSHDNFPQQTVRLTFRGAGLPRGPTAQGAPSYGTDFLAGVTQREGL
ncbi:hypothetical protein NDU88_006760 [Pleurodeles waltl]|uniref:Uncharacterized protein n=1 Tax=Pleurodeles waltl TaxID=8319 RepID=A0AAV7SQQ5_PLEWA|nr:hypothetical protein NDU88_006760 [Pleurodeles waltl]